MFRNFDLTDEESTEGAVKLTSIVIKFYSYILKIST